MLTIDLGSGQGQSLLEVVQAVESTTPVTVPSTTRLPSVADPNQAAQRLGWRTQRGLEDICRDGWAWQRQNPGGYA